MILAFDVSNSMRADDLEPTRIEAAQARRARVRRAAAAHDPDRRRRVRRQRRHRAAAEQRQGRGASRRSSGSRVGRRDVARSGPLHLAERDRGQAADDRRVRARQRQRRRSTSASSAPPRSCCSPTARTRRGPTRSHSPRSPRPRASTSTRSASAPRQGTVIEVDGFNVATALDAELLTEIADVTDGTYDQAADAAALTRIYKSDRPRVQERDEAARGHGAVRGRRRAAPRRSARSLSIVWFGRVI